MIPHSASTSSDLPTMTPHMHIDGDTCPWCEQEIPPERLEEISGRIAFKEREQARAITARLEQRYEIDKAQADAKAQADLELERQQSAAREKVAREEAKNAAEAVAAQQIAAVEAGRQELLAALQKQKDDAEAARAVAEQATADATAQLEKLRQETDAAKIVAKAEAERREAQIRDEAQKAADAAAAEMLADAEANRQVLATALQQQKAEAEAIRSTSALAVAAATEQLEALRQESQAALAAVAAAAQAREAEIRTEAQHAGAALQQQLDAAEAAKEAEIAQLKEEAEATAARIRQEAAEAAQALVAVQLAEKDQVATDAQAKAAEAEANLDKLAEQQEFIITESLKEQREVLEKAKDEALNAERAKTFDEMQKLSNKVNELQRALDQKTADELGEGAEVNLYEELRAEFPDDKIDRVGKGVAGGDVLHVVMHNERECGTIIYDSKNHKAFRTEHVAKLLADQLAAKAEHAILSTHKFPRGTGQLHNQDGVLLANPARVVAVVKLIRQHLVQTHTLRLSSAERESKAAALYEFIVSEQCAQFFARIDNCAGDLLDIQVKEKKWHEATWKKQGEAYRLIQKVQADLSNRISGIIGTAAAVDDEPELEEAAQ
jgi:hypothetical protein